MFSSKEKEYEGNTGSKTIASYRDFKSFSWATIVALVLEIHARVEEKVCD